MGMCNMMHLKDRVILITGAGRGWGRGMAIALAGEGASVIAAARTASQIEQTVRMVRSEGGSIEGRTVDVRDAGELSELFDFIEKRYGKLDVLVNNAGILPRKHFEDYSADEVTDVLNTNLRGQILGCRLAIPLMKKQEDGGSIICVSSVAGVMGKEYESIYAASKFGLEGFCQSISKEVLNYNIAVNTVSPGNVDPEIHLKPTSTSQEEYDALPEPEKKKYTLGVEYCEAIIYLAMQRPRNGGLTGGRFICAEMSEHIRRCGYDLRREDLEWNSFNKGWQ